MINVANVASHVARHHSERCLCVRCRFLCDGRDNHRLIIISSIIAIIGNLSDYGSGCCAILGRIASAHGRRHGHHWALGSACKRLKVNRDSMSGRSAVNQFHSYLSHCRSVRALAQCHGLWHWDLLLSWHWDPCHCSSGSAAWTTPCRASGADSDGVAASPGTWSDTALRSAQGADTAAAAPRAVYPVCCVSRPWEEYSCCKLEIDKLLGNEETFNEL